MKTVHNLVAAAARAFEVGNLEEAERLCRTVLQRASHPVAFNLLGLIAISTGRTEDAIKLITTAVRIDDENPAFRLNLARILEKESSKNPERGREHITEALVHYRTVLKNDPQNAKAAAGAARIMERLGETKDALEQVKSFLSDSPVNPDVLAIYAQLAHSEGHTRDAIERLQERLSRSGLATTDEIILLFRLGKLLDRNGRYDEAFAAYSRGNEFSAAAPDSVFTRRVDDLLTTFSAANLARLPTARNRSELPLFVVGMPRSGTTLVEQILDSHRDVHGAGELKYFRRLSANLHQLVGAAEPYPRCALGLTQSVVDQLADDHLAHLQSLAPSKARVVNKFPLNFQHLALIQIIVPGARAIHCHRHPLDTCLSIYFHPSSIPAYHKNNLESIGQFYRDYERLMGHWFQALDLPVFNLAYEDLIHAPEEQVTALLEFCGLDWDDNCLKFHENKRFVDSSSYDQVRQPMTTRSIDRWRNYEKHLAPLKEVLEIG